MYGVIQQNLIKSKPFTINKIKTSLFLAKHVLKVLKRAFVRQQNTWGKSIEALGFVRTRKLMSLKAHSYGMHAVLNFTSLVHPLGLLYVSLRMYGQGTYLYNIIIYNHSLT